MKTKRIARSSAVFTLILAFSAGCTHQDIKQGVDVQALEKCQIEKGKTTQRELVDALGPPMSTMSRGDGSEMLSWTGVQGHASSNYAGLVIPFAPVHMHADTHTASLQVTVKNGIVIDFTRTSGNQQPLNY